MEIEKLAREAGFKLIGAGIFPDVAGEDTPEIGDELRSFAALVIKEYERCSNDSARMDWLSTGDNYVRAEEHF